MAGEVVVLDWTEWGMVKGTTFVSHKDYAALARERDGLRDELDNKWAEGLHTCGNHCQRHMCVLRRDRDRLREALSPLAALDLLPDDLESAPDQQVIYARNRTQITVGDVRKARAALAGRGS